MSLWFYDLNPTAKERAAWMRERLHVQELVKAPPRRVWIDLPGVAPGQPDRAVSVKVERVLGRTYSDMCTCGDLQVDVAALSIDTAFDSVDLYALILGEAVTLEWHVDGEHQEVRVFLEHLCALGLDEGTTADEVRRAVRRKVDAERCHPDQGGAGTRFQELTALRDAALRAIGAINPIASESRAAASSNQSPGQPGG